MKYLVTGRAGSGKSAINNELQNRHLNSLDTDKIPGLASWVDLETGKRVQVDPSGFVDYSKVGWNWNPNILRGILGAKRELFLCGSASNELDFHPLFDKVFVLKVDPETQRQRLVERQSEYGKDPAMHAVIIEEQKQFVIDALKIGAVAVDNTQPVKEVVNEILDLVHGR